MNSRDANAEPEIGTTAPIMSLKLKSRARSASHEHGVEGRVRRMRIKSEARALRIEFLVIYVCYTSVCLVIFRLHRNAGSSRAISVTKPHDQVGIYFVMYPWLLGYYFILIGLIMCHCRIET